jgi:tetraacyldisaccharide 4'-kinase
MAVAAIAEPARFARALEAAGWQVVTLMGFHDHHRYTRRDIDRIGTTFRQSGASAVLTTAKDATRLLMHRPLPVPCAAVPLLVSIEPREAFESWWLARLARVSALLTPAPAEAPR